MGNKQCERKQKELSGSMRRSTVVYSALLQDDVQTSATLLRRLPSRGYLDRSMKIWRVRASSRITQQQYEPFPVIRRHLVSGRGSEIRLAKLKGLPGRVVFIIKISIPRHSGRHPSFFRNKGGPCLHSESAWEISKTTIWRNSWHNPSMAMGLTISRGGTLPAVRVHAVAAKVSPGQNVGGWSV